MSVPKLLIIGVKLVMRIGIVDLFYIWSGGKTLREVAKEYNMTKVQVFSAFIDDINKFAKEIKEILESLKNSEEINK